MKKQNIRAERQDAERGAKHTFEVFKKSLQRKEKSACSEILSRWETSARGLGKVGATQNLLDASTLISLAWARAKDSSERLLHESLLTETLKTLCALSSRRFSWHPPLACAFFAVLGKNHFDSEKVSDFLRLARKTRAIPFPRIAHERPLFPEIPAKKIFHSAEKAKDQDPAATSRFSSLTLEAARSAGALSELPRQELFGAWRHLILSARFFKITQTRHGRESASFCARAAQKALFEALNGAQPEEKRAIAREALLNLTEAAGFAPLCEEEHALRERQELSAFPLFDDHFLRGAMAPLMAHASFFDQGLPSENARVEMSAFHKRGDLLCAGALRVADIAARQLSPEVFFMAEDISKETSPEINLSANGSMLAAAPWTHKQSAFDQGPGLICLPGGAEAAMPLALLSKLNEKEFATALRQFGSFFTLRRALDADQMAAEFGRAANFFCSFCKTLPPDFLFQSFSKAVDAFCDSWRARNDSPLFSSSGFEADPFFELCSRVIENIPGRPLYSATRAQNHGAPDSFIAKLQARELAFLLEESAQSPLPDRSKPRL